MQKWETICIIGTINTISSLEPSPPKNFLSSPNILKQLTLRLQQYLPILEWLPNYTRKTFRADLIAGITVAIMLVPQGMAYSFLAGMPPIYGLYGGLLPLFLYGIFGTSRQLSIGAVAISSLLVLAGVSQVAEPGTAEYIELVILAGLLIGFVQATLSFLKMGFLVNFLSFPVLIGFTSAAAIIIAVSQLKDLLGFAIPRFLHPYETLGYAIQHLEQSNWISMVICISSIIVMVVLRSIKKSLPGALIVVIISTLVARGFHLERLGLDIVANVPEGLPAFYLPVVTWEKVRLLLPVVITVSIMGIVESISIAKVLEAKHHDYVVRPNQELLALGISKIGGAFFQSLPTSGSFTRSAINNDSGAKTGMASIITAVLIGLTLLFLTPLFYHLPKAVLAAIILLAVKSLFDFNEAKLLWKTHRRDFVMMLVTFLVTLGFGIEEGVMVGVILSLCTVLYRSSSPHMAVLGPLKGSAVYRNIERFEKASEPEAILIVRFDSMLYFANASEFKERIKALVREREEAPEALILDASSINDIDTTGLHALREIKGFLYVRDIDFYLSGVIGPVRDFLFTTKFMEIVGHENQFLQIHDAVLYHQGKEKGNMRKPSEDAVQTNIAEAEE